MTPAPATTRPRAVRLPQSVDLTYQGVGYRLAEAIRDRSTIRPASMVVACDACGKAIRQYGTVVFTPTRNAHPACGISTGLLVAIGKSAATERPKGTG